MTSILKVKHKIYDLLFKGDSNIDTASESEIQALNSRIMQSAAIPIKLNEKRKLQVSMFVWYRIKKLWMSAIFRFCDNGDST